MNNYSYVTYLTDDTYTFGIVLLVASMQKVNTKYPLHVLVTEEVSAPCIEMLDQLGVSHEIVEVIPMSDCIADYNKTLSEKLSVVWKNCWTQFKIFDLTQFDKIIFLDADVMLLKNLDHLFELPHMTAALDGEYFNIWAGLPHFNTGCMIIEPSHEEFEKILDFADGFTPEKHYREEPIANQEILNNYFKDWPQKTELHLDKYYNVFVPYIEEKDIEDIDNNAYLLHFIGRKPWSFWIFEDNAERLPNEKYYEQAKEIIEEKNNDFDLKKIQEKVTVTVYGICKNEIKSIKNYIKSFSKADYLCILDTGSTDGTWNYLQRMTFDYPNLIIDQNAIQPFRFDVARNESMKLIPKDTVLYFMADMDELIKEDNWVEKVKEAWNPCFNRGVYTYNRGVDKDDNVTKSTVEFRIHSKYWISWVNAVHEGLVNIFGEKFFPAENVTPIDITVWHYASKPEGFSMYKDLCKIALAEDPENYLMYLQLAIEYESENNLKDACDIFKKILQEEMPLQLFELARCFYGIGNYYASKDDWSTALHYFAEGRLTHDRYLDNYIGAANIYMEMGRYQEAIEIAERSLKHCSEIPEWCATFNKQSYYIYYLLAVAYYNLGEYATSLGYATIAHSKNINEDNEAIIKQIMENIFI